MKSRILLSLRTLSALGRLGCGPAAIQRGYDRMLKIPESLVLGPEYQA
jgi:hypothetical protein